MNWRPVVGLLGVAALLFTACQLGNNASTVTGGKALIAEPTTGVTFSQDFNPYDSNSVSSSMGTRSIVNEPLIEFDELDPTAAGTHPWLATAFQFANGGKDIQLTIRQNVKFNDGSSFGPADVAATYKVVANPKANVFGVPDQASDPTISGNTVTLHFTTPQYTSLFTILGKTYVLKESVAKQVAANPTLTIANPVGTGPFMLSSYSSSLIKWKPNPNYWGGTPPESEIDTPAIATNAAASDALISGQLDWAGNDIPNVYENYVNLNPQTNHAWFASGSTGHLALRHRRRDLQVRRKLRRFQHGELLDQRRSDHQVLRLRSGSFLRLLGECRTHLARAPAAGHGRDHQAGAGLLGLEHNPHLEPSRVADDDPLGQRRQHPVHPVLRLVPGHSRQAGGLFQRRRRGSPHCLREHRSQRHRHALPNRPEAREDHVDRRSLRSAPLWRGLERIQQCEIHGLAEPVPPIHEPFAERPANGVHRHAAQADFLTLRLSDHIESGRPRAGRTLHPQFRGAH